MGLTFNIKKARKELNLTQAELAKKSGVGRITINRLETGALKETTTGTLVALAKALDKTIDELIQP